MPRNRARAAGATLSILTALALAGCGAAGLFGQRTAAPAPVAASPGSASVVLSEYLVLLQKLVQGAPAEQAEIAASAQRDYDLAPTPSRELKLALILGTQGHPGANLPKAQGLLRELLANPEMLLPAERALTFLELSQIDDHLTLEAENRRLQDDAVRTDQQRVAAASRRLQTEVDENTRLRRELDEARAKLEAIANIERSLNERKPGSTGR